MDEDFNEHDEWVEGYLARVMQHEFDHLGGKMFIDRISPCVDSSSVANLRTFCLDASAALIARRF